MIRGKVEVNRLKIYAYHGVGEQERVVGNEFEVSVSLIYPSLRVAESDTVPMAINYADIIEIITQQMRRPSSLLENVAWRIHQAIVSRYPEVNQGSVKVAKLTPPLPCSLSEAAAVIEWD